MVTGSTKMTKHNTTDETITEKVLDLFEAIHAADTKQYDFLDSFSPEEQKKFVPFMFIQWMASLNSPKKPHLGEFAVISTNYYANQHLFSEQLKDHPTLTWQLMCAASVGTSQKYNHKWLPQLSKKYIQLEDKISLKEATEYAKKVPDFTDDVNEFVKAQNVQCDLALLFKDLKLSDIKALSKILTEDQLTELKEQHGIVEHATSASTSKTKKGKKTKG